MAETVRYLTKLSPDECIARLESDAVRLGELMIDGMVPVASLHNA